MCPVGVLLEYAMDGLASGVMDLRVVRLMRGLSGIPCYRDMGHSILSANHRANGAGEYIGLASTDEWMSCWGGPMGYGVWDMGYGPRDPTPWDTPSPNGIGKQAIWGQKGKPYLQRGFIPRARARGHARTLRARAWYGMAIWPLHGQTPQTPEGLPTPPSLGGVRGGRALGRGPRGQGPWARGPGPISPREAWGKALWAHRAQGPIWAHIGAQYGLNDMFNTWGRTGVFGP